MLPSSGADQGGAETNFSGSPEPVNESGMPCSDAARDAPVCSRGSSLCQFPRTPRRLRVKWSQDTLRPAALIRDKLGGIAIDRFSLPWCSLMAIAGTRRAWFCRADNRLRALGDYGSHETAARRGWIACRVGMDRTAVGLLPRADIRSTLECDDVRVRGSSLR